MRLFWTLGRRYPWQTLMTLAGILFAGVSEGFGLSALLPLLNRIFQSASPSSEAGELGLLVDRIVGRFLAVLGLEVTVPALLGLFVVCIVLKCLLVFLANKQIGYTVTRIATEMRLALLQALFQTRWEYFIRQPVGELTNGVATEAHRASLAFQFGARLASMAVEALIYLSLAVLVSWQATLLAMLGGGVILVALRGLIRKNRKAGRQQTVHTQALIAQMTDLLISIKPLKAMAREEAAAFLLNDRTRKVNRALQKQVLSKAYLGSLQEPILTLFLVLCLYSALVFWKLSLTVIIAMVFCVGKSLKQFQKIQHEYINLVEFESAYWSLAEKIEQALAVPERRGGLAAPELTQGIRFEDVSFDYDAKPVLREVTLEIAAGGFVVLFGPSGAGKSTIADLLIGLLRPASGEIRIDGVPLSQIDVRDWRRRVGYVPQENVLLHDTVFQNVALGSRGLSADEVRNALVAAGAWPFVEALPQGMFSVVGERGSMLSGGQRQRIAIARALVKRPRLLILDEATTALDPGTEKEVCASLRRLKGEITILAISHQSALLEEADTAYRVEGGRVTRQPKTGLQGR